MYRFASLRVHLIIAKALVIWFYERKVIISRSLKERIRHARGVFELSFEKGYEMLGSFRDLPPTQRIFIKSIQDFFEWYAPCYVAPPRQRYQLLIKIASSVQVLNGGFWITGDSAKTSWQLDTFFKWSFSLSQKYYKSRSIAHSIVVQSNLEQHEHVVILFYVVGYHCREKLCDYTFTKMHSAKMQKSGSAVWMENTLSVLQT